MEKNREKLTKRIVDAAQSQDQRTIIWDNRLPGFGLRITPNGLKTFILRYRPKGRSEKRYMTLGRYGPLTVEQARARAREMLGAVAFGKDPAQEATLLRQSPTLAEVCTDFLSNHVDAKLKLKTAASCRHAIIYHVLPQLGCLRIHEVMRRDIERFHSSLAAKPAIANYAITVNASMYGWAEGNGIVRENLNPARGITKYRENRRERFLTRDEFARLGAALSEAETVGIPYEVDQLRPTAKHAAKPENRRVFVAPDAVAAMRLLMVTGCRLREILNLRWQEVLSVTSAFAYCHSSGSTRRPRRCRGRVLLVDFLCDAFRSFWSNGHFFSRAKGREDGTRNR